MFAELLVMSSAFLFFTLNCASTLSVMLGTFSSSFSHLCSNVFTFGSIWSTTVFCPRISFSFCSSKLSSHIPSFFCILLISSSSLNFSLMSKSLGISRLPFRFVPFSGVSNHPQHSQSISFSVNKLVANSFLMLSNFSIFSAMKLLFVVKLSSSSVPSSKLSHSAESPDSFYEFPTSMFSRIQ